ncbi:Prephenate dehydratase [Nostocoides australiense Ben110]|uniref:Prephenate dehydratase n=1 Tax=Nostocoides australiense Ben110 TaxID=1193182 RepID=W6JVK3_9MICO|nr:prephenate dehydratase [Tetrasphaera australiensis]CCH72711.1 Prephenate dehydratase [Tetrasphaera australiensis Ben110]
MTRYGYFGPSGTFTEMALLDWPPARDAERVPFASVDATLAAVRGGDVDAAMVPIENSVEGGVSATLDALATGSPLIVIAERLVKIRFVLAAREGMTLEKVATIGTHSHAWAQVRGWVGANLPEVTYVPTLSTASAATDLAPGGEGRHDAAICAPVAAAQAGLQVLADDIGDIKRAVTRFVLVARPNRIPAPTGGDKTTVVLYQRKDMAGGLLRLLEQFATRGINMTRLESRPTKHSMGDYCFSVDIEGHVLDERVGEALTGLKRVCAEVVFLGSYARADNGRAQVAPFNGDDDFRAAARWLDAIRDLVQ